jgi:hypothetical protein
MLVATAVMRIHTGLIGPSPSAAQYFVDFDADCCHCVTS